MMLTSTWKTKTKHSEKKKRLQRSNEKKKTIVINNKKSFAKDGFAPHHRVGVPLKKEAEQWDSQLRKKKRKKKKKKIVHHVTFLDLSFFFSLFVSSKKLIASSPEYSSIFFPSSLVYDTKFISI